MFSVRVSAFCKIYDLKAKDALFGKNKDSILRGQKKKSITRQVTEKLLFVFVDKNETEDGKNVSPKTNISPIWGI
jgi:hypothetical protein